VAAVSAASSPNAGCINVCIGPDNCPIRLHRMRYSQLAGGGLGLMRIFSAGGHVSAYEPLFIESVTQDPIGEAMRMLQHRTASEGESL
jgi:hypothetical protein